MNWLDRFARTWNLAPRPARPARTTKFRPALEQLLRRDVPAGIDPSSLSGFVYVDANDNGVFEGGEAPVANVTVTLSGTNFVGQPITPVTALTGADGSYSFTNLLPGFYTVTETQPAGFNDGKDTLGTPGNGVVANDVLSQINLGSADNSTNNNFGEKPIPAPKGTIHGKVYNDVNANGTLDGADAGLPGVQVTLTGPNGTTTVFTGPDGAYSFTNLPAGTYTITETQPAGFLQGTNTPGTPANGTVTGDAITNVVVSGTNLVNYNFGEVCPPPAKARVGGLVFNDLNANGIQDAGDTGIPGVSVTYDNGAGLVGSTTTDASGRYGFDGPAGRYSLVINSAGYKVSPAFQGGDTAKDSDFILTPNTTIATATVTVTAGQTDNTIDAGLFRTASIGDLVFKDLNANGVQDGGEPGVAGVHISLAKSGTGDVVATTSTDAIGRYLFTDVTPGSYRIDVTESTLPAGFTFTTPNAGTNDAIDSDVETRGGTVPLSWGIMADTTLTSGEDDRTWDAGIVAPAPKGSIHGKVYNDVNKNGTLDGADAAIDGVKVTLTGPNGTTTVFTNHDGAYSFTNLAPGTYTITETQPAGFLQGTNTPGTPANGTVTGDAITNVVVSGTNLVNYNFGELTPAKASVGGLVFNDLNANGVQDGGEPGVAGVQVALADNAFFPFGNVIATTTTDSTGHYLFTNVTPGSYHIDINEHTLPAGFQFTAPNVGTNDAIDSDVETIGGQVPLSFGQTAAFTLTAGQTDTTVDAGIYKLASIGDLVFNDLNANGVQDSGEPGVAGVHISLAKSGTGDVVATTSTDAHGRYLFTGVTPGSYRIDITESTLPAGFTFTTPNAGTNDAIDSDVETRGGTVPLSWGMMADTTLTSGEDDRTWDAGIVAQKASIGDRIWFDNNGNGVQDSGEPGVAGVKVDLYWDSNGNTYAGTATTDANGHFRFDNLTPGEYHLDVQEGTLPAGFTFTAPNVGTNDAVDSDVETRGGLVPLSIGVMAITTLSPGEVDLTWDAGIVAQKGSISGKVYKDTNANGKQDAGEAGIYGVKLTLTGPNGTTTAFTNHDGAYSFTNLAPGTYTVTETQPAGFNQGTNTPGTPANGVVSGDSISHVAVSGTHLVNYNFGELTPPPAPKGSIAGTVFADGNKNGVQDAGEKGIAGVCVTLSGPGGMRTATTDVNGDYCFTDLLAGTYTLTESQPGGYSQGATRAGNLGGSVSGDVISHIPVNGNKGTEYNFAEQAKGSIRGKVGYDKDGDGWFGKGDGSLLGVKITLKDLKGNIKTAFTDKDGCYSFDDLDDGCYTITQSCPTGFLFGSLKWGNLGGSKSGDSICNVNVKGNHGTDYNFCNKLAFGWWAPPTKSIGCWW